MNFEDYSIYGNQQNTSLVPADMMTRDANDEIDWHAVLTGGIRGAAQGAISQLVGEKFRDGQLRNEATVRVGASGNLMPLLLIAGVAYLVLKG